MAHATLNPKIGTTKDIFKINCEKWSDVEGNIVSYSFYGNIKSGFKSKLNLRVVSELHEVKFSKSLFFFASEY